MKKPLVEDFFLLKISLIIHSFLCINTHHIRFFFSPFAITSYPFIRFTSSIQVITQIHHSFIHSMQQQQQLSLLKKVKLLFTLFAPASYSSSIDYSLGQQMMMRLSSSSFLHLYIYFWEEKCQCCLSAESTGSI